MFPSLVNCSTIDWFTKWPPDALLSVAEQCLHPLGNSSIIEKLSTICVSMHKVDTTHADTTSCNANIIRLLAALQTCDCSETLAIYKRLYNTNACVNDDKISQSRGAGGRRNNILLMSHGGNLILYRICIGTVYGSCIETVSRF